MGCIGQEVDAMCDVLSGSSCSFGAANRRQLEASDAAAGAAVFRNGAAFGQNGALQGLTGRSSVQGNGASLAIDFGRWSAVAAAAVAAEGDRRFAGGFPERNSDPEVAGAGTAAADVVSGRSAVGGPRLALYESQRNAGASIVATAPAMGSLQAGGGEFRAAEEEPSREVSAVKSGDCEEYGVVPLRGSTPSGHDVQDGGPGEPRSQEGSAGNDAGFQGTAREALPAASSGDAGSAVGSACGGGGSQAEHRPSQQRPSGAVLGAQGSGGGMWMSHYLNRHNAAPAASMGAAADGPPPSAGPCLFPLYSQAGSQSEGPPASRQSKPPGAPLQVLPFLLGPRPSSPQRPPPSVPGLVADRANQVAPPVRTAGGGHQGQEVACTLRSLPKDNGHFSKPGETATLLVARGSTPWPAHTAPAPAKGSGHPGFSSPTAFGGGPGAAAPPNPTFAQHAPGGTRLAGASASSPHPAPATRGPPPTRVAAAGAARTLPSRSAVGVGAAGRQHPALGPAGGAGQVGEPIAAAGSGGVGRAAGGGGNGGAQPPPAPAEDDELVAALLAGTWEESESVQVGATRLLRWAWGQEGVEEEAARKEQGKGEKAAAGDKAGGREGRGASGRQQQQGEGAAAAGSSPASWPSNSASPAATGSGSGGGAVRMSAGSQRQRLALMGDAPGVGATSSLRLSSMTSPGLVLPAQQRRPMQRVQAGRPAAPQAPAAAAASAAAPMASPPAGATPFIFGAPLPSPAASPQASSSPFAFGGGSDASPAPAASPPSPASPFVFGTGGAGATPATAAALPFAFASGRQGMPAPAQAAAAPPGAFAFGGGSFPLRLTADMNLTLAMEGVARAATAAGRTGEGATGGGEPAAALPGGVPNAMKSSAAREVEGAANAACAAMGGKAGAGAGGSASRGDSGTHIAPHHHERQQGQQGQWGLPVGRQSGSSAASPAATGSSRAAAEAGKGPGVAAGRPGGAGAAAGRSGAAAPTFVVTRKEYEADEQAAASLAVAAMEQGLLERAPPAQAQQGHGPQQLAVAGRAWSVSGNGFSSPRVPPLRNATTASVGPSTLSSSGQSTGGGGGAAGGAPGGLSLASQLKQVASADMARRNWVGMLNAGSGAGGGSQAGLQMHKWQQMQREKGLGGGGEEGHLGRLYGGASGSSMMLVSFEGQGRAEGVGPMVVGGGGEGGKDGHLPIMLGGASGKPLHSLGSSFSGSAGGGSPLAGGIPSYLPRGGLEGSGGPAASTSDVAMAELLAKSGGFALWKERMLGGGGGGGRPSAME